jgi:hypothetical protein
LIGRKIKEIYKEMTSIKNGKMEIILNDRAMNNTKSLTDIKISEQGSTMVLIKPDGKERI